MTLWLDTKFDQGTHFSLAVKEIYTMKRKILDEHSVKKRFWTSVFWWDIVIKKNSSSSGCNLTFIWTTVNEVATTTVITKTITLSFTTITKYIEQRKQKQRNITKPETKQAEFDDRSNSSENREQ